MKWSYILFLPAAVSMLWGLITLLHKRMPTRAQLLLSAMLLLEGLAMMVVAVFFRGRAGSLFIYHYLFEVMSVLCGPLYYIGACSLTEGRGATRAQRQVFWMPLLFTVVMTAMSFIIGPLRYERLCWAMREGSVADMMSQGGDPSNAVMLLWNRYVLLFLLVVVNTVIVWSAGRKIDLFQVRFNSFYADDLNAPHLRLNAIKWLSYIFLPVAVAVVAVVLMRPHYYKYYLILLSLVLTAMQWMMGQSVYRLDYDARSLAQYIRKERIQA